MISDIEMGSRTFVRKAVQNGEIVYLVIADGKVIFETPFKQTAYCRLNDERERLSVEEALFDAGLKIRPETLRTKQIEARRYVTIKNPDICRDFPIAWKVYYGDVLIGAYRSRWEAEQYRNKVILEGGY